MEDNEKLQEYLNNAEEWLNAAKASFDHTVEPAAFNALHAIELAAKAALLSKTGTEYKTHNIGGEFGKHFREEVGRDKCRELNRKIMKYNKLRYPGEPIEKEEAKEIIEFSEDFLKVVRELVRN